MIYLDMDGVLADFIDGMFRLLNIEPYTLTSYDEILDVAGGRENFWKEINGDRFFWDNLQEHHYARRLVSTCFKLDEVYILTASNNDNWKLIAGKIEWVKNHFSKLADKVIFKDAKWELARSGDVLIDDCPQNIEDWNKIGKGILYPRSWNTRSCENNYYCYTKVIEQLREIYD